MMSHLIRALAALLLLGLGAMFLVLEEVRFLFAAAAIGCLVEIALALRARRGRARRAVDRARFAAARISCSEQGDCVSVTLAAAQPRRGAAPYVLLSRARPTGHDAVPSQDDGPDLELSGAKDSIHGGIRDAYLSPRLLRVTLDSRGAELLGIQEICVTLPPGYDQRGVERTLRRVLRGVAFVSDRSLPDAEEDNQGWTTATPLTSTPRAE